MSEGIRLQQKDPKPDACNLKPLTWEWLILVENRYRPGPFHASSRTACSFYRTTLERSSFMRSSAMLMFSRELA
jgi:hypothetical protein